jgi:hypothetical protein
VKADTKLKVGSKGKNTENLQAFLATFGYLPSPTGAKKKKKGGLKISAAFADAHDPFVATASAPNLGTFDEQTQIALKSFQAFHGLRPTGILDAGTEAQMNLPRCGYPDFPGGGNMVAHAMVGGATWSKTDLTYSITKFSNGGLTEELIETAVEAAFDIWSDVTPLTFERVDGNADIKIRFEVGDHGDGNPFDGNFGVLAHAFFPEDGRAHFDDQENWAVDFPPTTDAIDLITVAAHEFGHLLGLDHIPVRGALMFPSYSGPQRFLAREDINAIQDLYQ